MHLICRTHASSDAEWDGCDYAVIHVTAELLARIAGLKEEAKKLKGVIPSLSHISVWDSHVDYLDDIPVEWEAWLDEQDEDGWLELPFPYDRSTATDELDGVTIKLGRTECETANVNSEDCSWEASPKHGSSSVFTPDFPQLSPLEQLSFAHIDTNNEDT